MEIEVKKTVLPPRTPNFLRTSDGDTIPIHMVSEENLRAIGAQFTEELVASAKSKRDARALRQERGRKGSGEAPPPPKGTM